ncbi:uncharacterized protein METZ01_LOCUS511422, partial [marine metagenome]
MATEMARNPATSPGNLEELSAHPSRKVCELVAQNPNTPEPVLKELWEFFPKSILENPIIDVWDLTGAVALWQRLPDPVLWGLYHHFMRANKVERIQGIIPEQVRLRFPIINKTLGYWLSQDPSANVRRQVAATAHRPELQLKLALDSEISVRLALAENRQLSAYCHRVMASDPEEKVQTVLANNTYVKGDAEMFGFNILAHSDFEQVRVCVAANPLTASKYIEILCL